MGYLVEAVDPINDSVQRSQEVPHKRETSGAAPGMKHSAMFEGLIQDASLRFVVRARGLHASGYATSPPSSVTVAPTAPPLGRIISVQAISVTESSVLLS